MLEPQLPHHRAEFERLGRRQRIMVLASPFAGGLLFMVLWSLPVPSWTYYSVFVLVLLGIAGLGIYEIRRTIVFYRDLRERRTLEHSDDADGV